MNIAISISAAILLISPTILLGAFLSETKTSAELVKCSDYYHDLMSNQDARIISKTGDVIYLKVPNNTKTIELNEEKRKSRIAQEIITIIEAIKPGVSIKADEIKECVMYMQKYKRSNLHVSAKNSGDKELSSKTLILGPKENWYLSVDMPVTDINQLTYDQTTNSVVEKEKPSSFYLGINYQFGDVLIDYDDKKFTDNLSLKFMAKASSPSESLGIGIAYSFEAIDVFVARVRTKEDESVGNVNLGTTDSTIIGVSFNISKGLEWLK